MPRFRIDFVALSALSLLLLLLVTQLPSSASIARSLEEIRRSGKLVVLTQNNPTTYYLDKDGVRTGPEYKLVKAFAKALGVTPYFEVKASIAELLTAIEQGEGDMAAAGLSVTDERKRRFLFSQPYQMVSQQVVCRRGGSRPRRAADLVNVELAVIAGSSYEERLKKLKEHYPGLTWKSTQGISAEQLLELVWRKQIACTVLDSNIVAINQRYYPELKVRFHLGNKDDLAWLLPQGAEELQKKINTWLDSYEASKKIASIQEQYYGHVALFDYVDTTSFVRKLNNLYSSYQPYFQEAAAVYSLPESLLAAQSYQESHWNPYAKSPTGVRGMMMLTRVTAKAMGVVSRTDPKESIMGGAKYLAELKARLSKNVEEPDLTWFALAAYNVGIGHLRDAQKLARHFDGNPYRWHDVKDYLPLLSDPRYYKFMKYGYARGSEPVLYVQQVRQYEQILTQHLLVQKQSLEAASFSDSGLEKSVDINSDDY
ncbi:MAG: membrane-bound lytic murein transglycosylase MltF [Pseudomonadales bacterium]|nr:membrane-bound lytic murein transglycosylase MltF [Pseudomonadales bacterium]